MARLLRVLCTDSVSSWRKLGFHVDEKHQVTLSNLVIQLEYNKLPKTQTSLVGWEWSGFDGSNQIIGGITTMPSNETTTPQAVIHPNSVTSVDHVVVRTKNCDVTKDQFEAHGITVRRDTSDIYPGLRQMFFRTDNSAIIEVVGPVEPKSDRKSDAFLWGMTLVSPTLQDAKLRWGTGASDIRSAKQSGREILTVRNKEFGIDTNIAVMSPHISLADGTSKL